MNKKIIILFAVSALTHQYTHGWGWDSISEITKSFDNVVKVATDQGSRKAIIDGIQKLAVEEATAKLADIPAIKAAQDTAQSTFGKVFPGVPFPVTTKTTNGIPTFDENAIEQIQTKVNAVSSSTGTLLASGSFEEVVTNARKTVDAIKDAHSPEEKKEAILEAAQELAADQQALPAQQVAELAPLIATVEQEFATEFPGQNFPIEKNSDGTIVTIDGQQTLDEVKIEKLMVEEITAHPEVGQIEPASEAIMHIKDLFEEAENAPTDKSKQIAFVKAMEAIAEEQVLAPAAEAYGHLNDMVEEALNGLKNYIPGAQAPIAHASDGSEITMYGEPLLDPIALQNLFNTAQAMPDTTPISPAQKAAEEDWFKKFMDGEITPTPSKTPDPAELAAEIALSSPAAIDETLMDLGQHLTASLPTGDVKTQPFLDKLDAALNTLEALLAQPELQTIPGAHTYLQGRLVKMAGA